MEDRMKALESKFDALSEQVKENTDICRTVSTDTKEIIAAFQAWKGAFAVLEFFGKLAKPFLWITATASVAWAAGKALVAQLPEWFK